MHTASWRNHDRSTRKCRRQDFTLYRLKCCNNLRLHGAELRRVISNTFETFFFIPFHPRPTHSPHRPLSLSSSRCRIARNDREIYALLRKINLSLEYWKVIKQRVWKQRRQITSDYRKCRLKRMVAAGTIENKGSKNVLLETYRILSRAA